MLCSNYSIDMTSFQTFHIGFRSLSTKVIPSIEDIVLAKHFSLRGYSIQPDTFHFLIAKKRKEPIYVINIKI